MAGISARNKASQRTTCIDFLLAVSGDQGLVDASNCNACADASNRSIEPKTALLRNQAAAARARSPSLDVRGRPSNTRASVSFDAVPLALQDPRTALRANGRLADV